jgi:hypothetical protein
MAAGGFKTFTTGEVLTAADTNNFLMQGVLVFDDAAARDAAITAPVEGQVVYLKDTNAVLSYDGTSYVGVGGSSPLTTKGDLYTFSTSDTRLGVGANGTVLTAASGEATGLEWAAPSAGGMTLISTTTLTGSTVTISSIPQTYNNLQLVITSFLPSVDGVALRMRFNANSTANEHAYANITTEGYAAIVFNRIFATLNTGAADNVLAAGFYTVDFPDYTNTVSWKTGYSYATDVDSGGADAKVALNYLLTNQTAAISSIQLFPSSGTFAGTAKLYGVK